MSNPHLIKHLYHTARILKGRDVSITIGGETLRVYSCFMLHGFDTVFAELRIDGQFHYEAETSLDHHDLICVDSERLIDLSAARIVFETSLSDSEVEDILTQLRLSI